MNVKSQLKRELMEGLPGSAPVTDFPGYMLGLPEKGRAESHPLRNPFDIPRSRLLDQLVRMRANLVGRGRSASSQTQTVDSDTRHTLPIAQMGNYQDYLKKQPMPLRELESQPVRQHMFGNPFKINKNLMMGADEVSGIGAIDEVQLVGVAGPQSTPAGRGVKRTAETLQQPGPPKRRKGALPKDFQFVSPSSSPARSDSPPPSPALVSHAPTLASCALHSQSLGQITSPASNNIPAISTPLSKPPGGLSNGVAVTGLGSIYPGGKMAAFRSQCEVPDPMEVDPPALVMEEGKLHGQGLMRENEDDDIVQVVESEEAELDELKTINNMKKKQQGVVTAFDSLSYDSSPSLTPPDSPARDCSSPPLLSLPEVPNATKLEVNGKNNGVYQDYLMEPLVASEHRSPSPVMIKPVPSESVSTEVVKERSRSYSAEELRSIRLRNNNVRQLIYKEVKKPGRVHGELWEMLGRLHGPAWVRRQFIMEVKQEAVRQAR